jgi:hypothetical protein
LWKYMLPCFWKKESGTGKIRESSKVEVYTSF